MRQFQAMSKGTEARDFNLIQGNSNYVQTWSMAQIFVVIICTIVQVRKNIYYFLALHMERDRNGRLRNGMIES